MRLLSLCILHIALVVTGELYIYDMIISCLELACQDKRLSCYSIKATIFSTLTQILTLGQKPTFYPEIPLIF